MTNLNHLVSVFPLLSSFLSGSDQTPSNHVLDQASQQTHQWSSIDGHRLLAESQNGNISCCNSQHGGWGGAAFMGIWVPPMAPKHCGKFHFLWKPFTIRWRSIPLCSLLMMCILELTRSFIASLTFMHAVEVPIPNLSPISLYVVQSFSYAFEQHRYDCSYRYRIAQSGYLSLKAAQITHQLFKHIFRDTITFQPFSIRKVKEFVFQNILNTWDFPVFRLDFCQQGTHSIFLKW